MTAAGPPKAGTAGRSRVVGQGLPAPDGAGARDPAAAPDQRALLVIPAPHVPADGRHREAASAADQCAEAGVAVPARYAYPDDVAVRSDESAALAVGKQRVLAQYTGWDRRPRP